VTQRAFFLSCRSILFLLQHIPLVYSFRPTSTTTRIPFILRLALYTSSMRDRTIFHLLACGLSLFSPLITTPNRPGFRRRTADEMTRLRPRLRPLRHQERGFLRSRLNHQRYRLNLGSPFLRFRPLPLRTPTVTREGRFRHIVKLSSSFNQIPISSIVIVNCNGCLVIGFNTWYYSHGSSNLAFHSPRTSSLASLPRLSHQHPHLSPTCQSNATSPIRREGECKDTPSPLRHGQLAYKYKGQRQITRPTLAWSRRSRSLVGERINVLN